MRPLWLLFAVLLMIPAVADAGPRRRDRGDQVAQRPGGPRDPGVRREKAKARIRAMRAMILTEELDLDEATAARLAPILTQYDDALAKLLANRLRLRDELRAAEQIGDDGQMRRLLDALVHNQDQRWDLERQRFAELRKALTPRQAARLVDVLPEIDRRILKGLRAQRQPAP